MVINFNTIKLYS